MKWMWNTLIWTGGAAALFALLSFIQSEQEARNCTDIVIDIDHGNSGNEFIRTEEIREIISDMGIHEASSIGDIETRKIEYRLGKKSSVLSVNAYTTIEGELRIDLKQRRPIVRVFSDEGSSYYIDEEGSLMMLSEKYTSRVLVANGYIQAPYDQNAELDLREYPANDSLPAAKVLHDLYTLALKLEEDPFWKSQINQVYSTESGELELIPRVGSHRIIIGDTRDLDKKLKKLMVFYQKGLPKTGWNEYSVINLKFRDQVVCTKK